MKNHHESASLNSLLGKNVVLTMFDGCVEEGILGRSEYSSRYKLERNFKGPLHFYKSHIKKIEEVRNENGVF